MTQARSLLVPPNTPGVYHCVSRCVRRAFLCGRDVVSGRSFEHRRAWMEERLLALSEIFAVSLLGYAVMANHVHVVLQVQPDNARRWSDEAVAARWVALFPPRVDDLDAVALKRAILVSNPQRLAVCRARLADLSWFMRCLSEPIARRANREDGCTGRFWEGRFKCQALLDDAAVLAAMAYVDLNPIRAGLTTRLDRSEHTSVARRLALAQTEAATLGKRLAPVAGCPSRALPSLRVRDYLELVDWTGRQVRPGKRGAIPLNAPSALARIGTSDTRWLLSVRGVGNRAWRALGSAQALLDKAAQMGQRWLKGLGTARALARV